MMWEFLDWNLKQPCHIWNKHPQVCLFAKFDEKTKMLKFGTRNAWKHPNVLKLELESSIVIFEINTVEFVYLKNSAEKQNAQIWNQKSFTWAFLGDNFKNTIVIFESSPTQFCLFVKFDQKTEMPRFRTRNALFEYFLA